MLNSSPFLQGVLLGIALASLFDAAKMADLGVQQGFSVVEAAKSFALSSVGETGIVISKGR